MGAFRLLVLVVIAAACSALQPNPPKQTDTSSRRIWISNAAMALSALTPIVSAKPALALRSIMDPENQARFDKKEQLRLNPPVKEKKTLQEMFGTAPPKKSKTSSDPETAQKSSPEPVFGRRSIEDAKTAKAAKLASKSS